MTSEDHEANIQAQLLLAEVRTTNTDSLAVLSNQTLHGSADHEGSFRYTVHVMDDSRLIASRAAKDFWRHTFCPSGQGAAMA